MCGRYAATKDPAKLAAEFDAVDATEGQAGTPDYNKAPTRNAVTVVQRHPRDAEGKVLEEEPAVRSLRVMRWGLVPFWAKDPAIGNRMINTRAETATEKPAFRKALARRRCLVPADGWYEWRATGEKKAPKEPFYTTRRDGSSLAFAGIWESWRDPKSDDQDTEPLVTFSVLTTDAVGQLADIHDRMPLLLPRDRWDAWLDPDNADATDLLAPPPLDVVDALELRPVSTKVNNVRNNGPELLERVEPEPVALDGAPAEDTLFDVPGR
ncbi:Putative SOS response-associated peptidase YedK [Amycolatopsis arida]|uniref:Abasic site processing protein n=1 Tax=Amycolatopsis arida TaxID=587909 RepID=A0A1I5PJC0_9PSEU|nr:SOS response-associated peptidase [Amycolatopsis arida]TDX98507.1 putative SOS response-associated peptidase YedK [Amycolatopsis arida]SFP33641.1 Putative SOS response-associated peptidase YedK [Amycolatopsis arida]